MTSKIIFATKRLGEINDNQLQSIIDKFNLGKLMSYEKTAHGVMGQTMFVSTTKGKFVFKGNPLYPGQLVEEKFFIENIEKRTDVPVPTPYLIDDSEEPFGWSYSLMPLLEGEHLNSVHLKASLNLEDKFNIAETIASTLLSLHNWKVNSFGDLDTETFEITPFKDSYTEWLFNRMIFWLNDAKKYSEVTTDDFDWVKCLLEEAEEDFIHFSTPTFVMGDFKPENFLMISGENGWEISGLFDFTNSYFADPLSDLIKMIIYYLDHNESEIAKHLLDEYFAEFTDNKALKNRLKVHMLHQCILDWGSAKATKMVTWDDQLSFATWAEKYTSSVEGLLV